MAGDPRGSRLLHWARPWSAVIPGELHSCCLYRIIFYRGGAACGPPNTAIKNDAQTTRSNLSQHKTSLRDLPLLFVYFQVNNGVLYYLDYVEDIYIRALSVLVSTLDP